MWQAIEALISNHLERDFSIQESSAVSGGCINEAFRISDGVSSFFVKRHPSESSQMFEAEFDALKEMHSTETIQVPLPLGYGVGEGGSWLVTEYLTLQNCSSESQFQLGHQLAGMHQVEQSYYGWHRDNTIGRTHQPNDISRDWPSFWRDHRLAWQFSLAHSKGFVFRDRERLLEEFGSFFDGYQPSPSLLHGDLWYGNVAALPNGNPVIFDPASYYGDAEAEFGIIDMFGGFSEAFYQGYESVRPFQEEFQNRKLLYRLYHELNHLNLFGSGYAAACEQTMRQIMQCLDRM